RDEERQSERVRGKSRPLDETHRGPAHGVRADDTDDRPDDLVLPRAGGLRRDVGLTGGVDDGEAENRERDRHDDERQVDVDATSRRHQPVFSTVLLICTWRKCAMIFVAKVAEVDPSKVTFGTMTTTTILGSSAGAMPANQA